MVRKVSRLAAPAAVDMYITVRPNASLEAIAAIAAVGAADGHDVGCSSMFPSLAR
jgi:hypothetical protein